MSLKNITPKLSLLILTAIQTIAVSGSVPAQESYLRTDYDKFDDETVVMLFQVPLAQGVIGWMPAPMTRITPEQLNLTLVERFKGRQIKTRNADDSVYCTLSAERELGLLTAPKLILLMDGERIELPTEWRNGYDKSRDKKQVRVSIQYDLLVRLAAAKAVEGRLGSTEFHLTSRNKEQISNFIKATSPQINVLRPPK